MRVLTVEGGSSHLGAKVVDIPFYETTLKAITVGSLDSGCRLGFLRVLGNLEEDLLLHVDIELHQGKAHLRQTLTSKSEDEALMVLRTPVNKGGKNFHTGDRKNSVCLKCSLEFDFLQDVCPSCRGKLKGYYHKFPGEILASGTVRDSKRPVYGDQYVCLMKKGQVFRTAYDGYGNSGCHYHVFNGKKVISSTWEERLNGKFE
ncbi:MAG: hypothetical protein EBV07_00830 [Proteobacteria bacterium]|nr:hypothetical protein [Pseudomonadota bacterium]